ncbi:TatD family hydrolase [Pseudidiomarina sp. E22-M8]|uniref:TatD family hydrolase n=1 Tax=Pseudidiomarina sp. E22-M8 TaxID=3424768 RepID=UPI00403CFEF5
MDNNLFDSHCHLDFEVFDDDREEVVERAYAAGVRAIFIPGTRRDTPRIRQQRIASVELYYGVGLHPYFIDEHKLGDIDWVEQQLQQHSAYWVGEIGLDKTCSDWDKQCKLFVRQVELAVEHQRSLILHHRNSQNDLLHHLKPYLDDLPQHKGILHAFSGSYEQAQDWVSKGFKLGIGGTITYTRAKKTRAAVQAVPLDALVLETDAPDMPLRGHQGQRNEPCRVAEVISVLAELRGEAYQDVARQLWQTSRQLIPSPVTDDNATC